MLAAAGLGATWVFRKARVLAIFDDLDTILLMSPLQMMLVGFRWQLMAVVAVMGGLLWAAWRYLHLWRIPHRWPWGLGYSAALALMSELGVATVVSSAFMVLVGLSMPPLGGLLSGTTAEGQAGAGPAPSWGVLMLHVLAVTLLINAGKMFPAVCYRRDATFRERLALAIALFPRGEVGACVLVMSLS